jgi:hypothetical protein
MQPNAPLDIRAFRAFRTFQWRAAEQQFTPSGDVVDISGTYLTR